MTVKKRRPHVVLSKDAFNILVNALVQMAPRVTELAYIPPPTMVIQQPQYPCDQQGPYGTESFAYNVKRIQALRDRCSALNEAARFLVVAAEEIQNEVE